MNKCLTHLIGDGGIEKECVGFQTETEKIKKGKDMKENCRLNIKQRETRNENLFDNGSELKGTNTYNTHSRKLHRGSLINN